MSRRGNIKKRIRQHKRHEQHPRSVAPSISSITGEVQQSLQLPTTSEVKRISTAALIAELQRRPDSRGLIAAFAERYK